MSKDPSDQIIDNREAGRSSGVGDNPWDKLTGKFGDEDSTSYGADDLDALFIPEGKREAYINPDLRDQLNCVKAFIEKNFPGWQKDDSNRLILYPGSNSDGTMADVFGDRVVHVDSDGHALGFLERKNLETKHMRIEEYIDAMPEEQQIDMLLSYNAGSVSESALERLREGGIVLANNWHGSADDLYAKEGLEMVGAVVYESKEFVADEEAESLLGTEQFVYTPGGIKPNPTEEERAAGTVFEQYRSPDTLWIFCKKPVESE